MDSPVPVPRSQHIAEVKKPIPTPRRSVKARLEKIPEPEASTSVEESTNTLSKKVSSISSASKQFAEDLGQLVHDRKKAVIEGTRQSVRRLTRRFSSSSEEKNNNTEAAEEQKSDDENINIFNSITFNSPISQTENIYNNVEDSKSTSSDEELIGLPPPSHPPPPLPDDSLYDAPLSLSSSGNSIHSASSVPKSENYEHIFPIHLKAEQSRSKLSRSESWKFYDPVSNRDNESVSTSSDLSVPLEPVTVSTDLESEVSSIDVRNSLYENYEIIPKKPPRASKSVILQFDPLNPNNKGT